MLKTICFLQNSTELVFINGGARNARGNIVTGNRVYLQSVPTAGIGTNTPTDYLYIHAKDL
jgi:hypothetical protein